MLGTLIQDDVVNRHVHRVVRYRRLHFVGRTDKHLRSLESLVHTDDFGPIASTFTFELTLPFFLFGRRLVHGIADNLLIDLDHLKLSVIAFFECVKKICCGMNLTVILDFFITLQIHR